MLFLLLMYQNVFGDWVLCEGVESLQHSTDHVLHQVYFLFRLLCHMHNCTNTYTIETFAW